MAAVLLNLMVISSVFAADKLVFSTFENAGITMVEEPVMREVYRRLGYQIEIRQFPGARAIQLADQGNFDGELARLSVVRGMFENLVMVPTPIHKLKNVVFTRDADFTPRGWDSLKPFSVVTLTGYKYNEKKLKEHGINHYLVTRFDQVLNTVKAGRYDIGLLVMLDGLRVMKDEGIRGLRILDPPLETFPIYHFLHKKQKALVPLVNEKLMELRKEGFVKRVEKRVILELTRE